MKSIPWMKSGSAGQGDTAQSCQPAAQVKKTEKQLKREKEEQALRAEGMLSVDQRRRSRACSHSESVRINCNKLGSEDTSLRTSRQGNSSE